MAAAPEPVGPRAGIDYPADLTQFFDWFADEAACWRYLERLRWPAGFSCPSCGHTEAWRRSKSYRCICTSCGRETSLLVGTLFEHSRLSLREWLYIIWLVAGEKRGVSAKSVQNALGLGSYKTAWLALQKVRLAMTKTSPDRLAGVVEVDETYVGGVAPGGKRGRGAPNKAIVAIAVERVGFSKRLKKPKFGRVRMRVIPDVTRATLEDFITDVVAPGATIHTDGKREYDQLEQIGYKHLVTVQKYAPDPAHVSMPGVHLVASLLKRWLLGTHQGGLARQHLDGYLDEFVFRFNRRTSRQRGLVFYRLVTQCLNTRPLTYETLVLSRRPQRGKRRGPPPKSELAAAAQAAAHGAADDVPF